MRVVVAHEPTESPEPTRRVVLGLGLECGASDCVPMPELPVRLAQGGLDLLLVRVAGEHAAAQETIRQAVALTRAPVLAIGPATDVNTILQTTRSGAREYLDQSRLQEDLESALEKLRLAGVVTQGVGIVLSVCSATPGSGVSTVATNLAFTLGGTYPNRVALLELGRGAADLTLSLNLQPRHTVNELTQNWQRMDATLLRQSMLAHPAGVNVLPQATDGLSGEAADPQAFRKAIILMRSVYTASVLDLGHLHGPEQYQAMRLSDSILLVVRLDVPGLRQAKHFLKLCAERGVPRERIRLVANRYGQKGQIAWKRAEEAVGAKFAEYIPEDCGKANDALNKGEPLVCAARYAAITRRFGKLAAQLNGKPGK